MIIAPELRGFKKNKMNGDSGEITYLMNGDLRRISVYMNGDLRYSFL